MSRQGKSAEDEDEADNLAGLTRVCHIPAAMLFILVTASRHSSESEMLSAAGIITAL